MLTPKRPNVISVTLTRPEGKRHYLMAAPAQAPSGKPPLVIVLHGKGSSAEQVLGMKFPPSPLSMWLEIAEREQLVVVAPDGGKGSWNDGFVSNARNANKDDVGFVSAIIDQAIAESDVDPTRVYVIGVSKGGMMAFRLAAEIAPKLAAFATVLASMPERSSCWEGPKAALSALIIASTKDPFIPYNGGKFMYTLGVGPMISIDECARVWRELAGLSGEPIVTSFAHHDARDPTCATSFLWGADPDKLQVGLFKIENGGHTEPSKLKRYPRLLTRLIGAQNADFEVAEAAWDFFKNKRSVLPRSFIAQSPAYACAGLHRPLPAPPRK